MNIRSQLILIDTCVVIDAFRLGVWEAIVDQCQVVLPRTVVDEVIQVGREFDDVPINIEELLDESDQKEKISIPELLPEDLKSVYMKCGPSFRGEIHDGELECLAYLLKHEKKQSLACSSDAVVFRYLGWTELGERGIALEEVLHGIGIRRALEKKHTKDFREKWTNRGFTERLQME